MEYREIHRRMLKYIDLSENDFLRFVDYLQPVSIKRKDYLLQPGQVCGSFSLVRSGCLMNYFSDEKGEIHVLQFATEMWWTADLESLIRQCPSRYSIQALEDSEVLSISRSKLEELYTEIPVFERYFRMIFQNALISHQQRIIRNIAYSAEERYDELIRLYPDLEQRVAARYIASYLGITPVFLSKLKSLKHK